MSCFLCTHKPDPEFPKLNCNEWSKLRWVNRGQHGGSVGRKSTRAFSFISGGRWDGQRGSGVGEEEGWGMCVTGTSKPHLCPRAQLWRAYHRGQGAATAHGQPGGGPLLAAPAPPFLHPHLHRCRRSNPQHGKAQESSVNIFSFR